MATKLDKLNTLLEVEGFSGITELMEDCEFGMRCGVPAICMNPDCDYVQDMEPDQNRGWCPECETNTLVSAYVLMGVI